MPDPTPTPTLQPGLHDNEVTRTILQALGHAVIDYWYVWVLMLLVAVALTYLSAKADRFVERREAERASRRGKRRR